MERVGAWSVVRGLGGMYLECRRVEGSQDASHSRWMVAWCLTMSKSRCPVFLFRLTAELFFLGLLLYLLLFAYNFGTLICAVFFACIFVKLFPNNECTNVTFCNTHSIFADIIQAEIFERDLSNSIPNQLHIFMHFCALLMIPTFSGTFSPHSMHYPLTLPPNTLFNNSCFYCVQLSLIFLLYYDPWHSLPCSFHLFLLSTVFILHASLTLVSSSIYLSSQCHVCSVF